MASLKSPRPTPQFFNQTQTLSTKKARATPREQPPPRPPVKSAPPVSRIFQHKISHQRAQTVSFLNSSESILSPHYNERSKDLYFEQCFEIDCKLGAGSFGEVFKVRSVEDGKYYAVKRSREKFRGESDRKRKLAEVQKHEQLPKHPNCIQFIKAWEEQQHLYIQTELCETSLSHYSDINHEISETLIWNYLVDLLLAVKHLHSHDLVHMDIKPANIFIAKDGTCKLGDFGLVLDLCKEDISEAQEGDPKYLAPELLEGKFGKAADIFSLGITLLELACDLDLPRGDKAWHELRCGKFPEFVGKVLSPELKNVIYLMMYPDYQFRPSVYQLLAIPAVKKICRRRDREKMYKYVLLQIKAIFNAVLMFLFIILRFFIRVFSKLKGKTVSTPPRCVSPTINWEQSFSDDEDFADNSINSSQSSIGCSLLDNSLLGESRNGSFTSPCSANNILNSTPTMNSFNKINSRSTPANHFNLSDSFSLRYSPDSSRPNSSYKNSSSLTPTSRLFQREIEETPKLGIGPKNLLQVFEAASNEN